MSKFWRNESRQEQQLINVFKPRFVKLPNLHSSSPEKRSKPFLLVGHPTFQILEKLLTDDCSSRSRGKGLLSVFTSPDAYSSVKSSVVYSNACSENI